MTLWIGAAASVTMIVMFVLGLWRGQSAESLFITAIALAIAAIPEALPDGGPGDPLAGRRGAGQRRRPSSRTSSSVETLGSTSAINSDKTGTLTMNQMTAVEVLDPVDRYTITGHRLRPRGQGPARGRHLLVHRRRHPPVRHRQRRQARGRQGRRRPHRGRPAGARPQGRPGHRRQPRAVPAARDAAVRPHLQAHGHVQPATDADGQERGALLRQGRGAGRDRPRRHARSPTARPACPGTTT